MAAESQEEGILRYLKDMDYRFHEPLTEPGSRFEYDLKHIARDAMTKGAQLRMTNTTFPQELRLQVMKASVLYHLPTFTISSTTHSTSDDFTDALASLFDRQQPDGALHDTLKDLAEQALFETAIFKVQNCVSQIKLSDMHSTAPFLDEVGERVRYLELIAHVFPGVSCQATLEEATNAWNSLKDRLPKLKACVLTVVFRTRDYFEGNFRGVYYDSIDQTPFRKELLHQGPMSGGCLGDTLTKLFAEFAEKGPGARRFIRVKHIQFEIFADTATPHLGPLVAVNFARSDADAHEGPSGATMLTGAYQLARTGEKTEHTFKAHEMY